MFTILAVLLIFMALPIGRQAVSAVDGVTDLRRHDLSDAVYMLTGQWQVTPRRHVMPGEFPDDAATTGIPEWWPRSFDELNTYATYRLTVLTNDTRQLNMFIPEIYTAYKLWVNGEFVRGAGVLADNPADAEPMFESVIVPVRADDGIIEIVIQGSNFHYMRPIMGSVILLGESDSSYSMFFRSRSIYIMALGMFIAGAFYHFALYVLRRKETIYLLFTLLSLLCFWRYAIDTDGISNLTGWFSTWGGLADLKVFITLFFLHGIAITAYCLHVFDRAWMEKYRLWVLGYTVVGAVIFAVIPWNTHHAPLIVITALAPVVLLTIYKGARSRELRKNKMMWLIFIAYLLFAIISVIQKYFFDHILYMTGMVAELFLLMSQALILSSQYTQTVKREQELALENNALDRVNRLKNDLVATISHELRTPLTVMSTYSQLAVRAIARGDYTNESIQRLSIIPAEAKRLANLFETLLMSFNEQDGVRTKSAMSITELLTQTTDVFKSIMVKKQNKQILDITEDLPPVYGNSDELMQVIFNLLSNAHTHTKEGEIVISVIVEAIKDIPPLEDSGFESSKTQCKYIRISIKDTGEGIAPELLPHVLEKRKGDERGTGYGLSICKEIIEDHGGKISIESVPGTGTNVEFTIPVMERRRRNQRDEEHE